MSCTVLFAACIIVFAKCRDDLLALKNPGLECSLAMLSPWARDANAIHDVLHCEAGMNRARGACEQQAPCLLSIKSQHHTATLVQLSRHS